MAAAAPRINRIQQARRFLRVARLLLWTLWVIYRERRRVLRGRERGDSHVQPDVEKLIQVLVAFRKTALELGVLMIKLGQFLSSRADLLPERALEVLTALQDEVPPAPYSHVVSVIESELGKPLHELFSVFEEKATAAASLGQVHRARLASTGEEVAVKVQRPYIEQLVNMDLGTIRFVIWVISRFVNVSETLDLMGLYREFKRTTFEEIDYMLEARNAQRFADMFEGRREIFIPRVHQELLSKRVLVLEWVDGIKINDYRALDAARVDRMEVARRTVEAYFYQFFEVGFFHADPHPGNIFVRKGADGDGPVIAFVDFGMVGSLTKPLKQGLKDLFLAFVVNNSHAATQALRQLGFIGEGANMVAIERGIDMLLDQYYGITMGQARDLDLSTVASEVEDLLYHQPFRIPSQFAYGGRAVGTLSGLATGLAPDFNLVEIAVPYAQKFLGLDAGGAGDTIQELLRQAADAGRSLLALPATMERIAAKLESGQIRIQMGETPPSGAGRRWRRRAASGASAGGGRLSLMVTFLASLGAGVALSLNQASVPSWFCFGLAAVTALATVLRG